MAVWLRVIGCVVVPWCLLGPAATFAAEHPCLRAGAAHSEVSRGAQSLAAHADHLLAADLAAAAAMEDPLQAIARLQHQLYTMQHPEIEGNFGWYGTIRCGSEERYQALQDAIASRVAGVRERYRADGLMLGKGGADRLTVSAEDGQVHQQPGLLELLLMANRYQRFEQQAREFLRSARSNPAGDALFKETIALARSRLTSLRQWAERLDTESGRSLVGLLPAEQAGLQILEGFAERIDPLRDDHVDYWLGEERAGFAQLEPAPDRLFSLPNRQDQRPLQALENALRVARTVRAEELRELADARGGRLMEMKRFVLAQRYYKLAGNEAKAELAWNQASDINAARAAQVERAARDTIQDMKKSAAEQQAFEDETDDLASELGIDLESF